MEDCGQARVGSDEAGPVFHAAGHDENRRAYRDAWLRGIRLELALVVKHRTFHYRQHGLRRRLPARAAFELNDVRDRAELLRQVPTHQVTVWVEGDVKEEEAVTVPLTGWSANGGPLLTLTFDAVVSDLDTKPLLASHTEGTMQIGTEVHLTFRGRTLRTWRYAELNRVVHACGKRTVHLIPASSNGQRTLREATGQAWQAMGDDAALLLSLDVPAYGTDGLADLWHVCAGRIVMPTHALYRVVVPQRCSLAREPAAATADVLLSIHDADGLLVASGQWTIRWSLHPVALDQRRVGCCEAMAAPTSTPQLTFHAKAAGSAAADSYVPRTGAIVLLLYQHGRVALSASSIYIDQVDGFATTFGAHVERSNPRLACLLPCSLACAAIARACNRARGGCVRGREWCYPTRGAHRPAAVGAAGEAAGDGRRSSL